jgi:Mono-functional DNA-alkylating methyl methanesulfonate N-term
MQCWANVGDDDTRFLLGDHKGGLHLLLLAHNDAGELVGLSLRRVGLTTSAAAITYLDSGVCFVGSRCANSQLIKLHSEPVDPSLPNNFVQVRQCLHTDARDCMNALWGSGDVRGTHSRTC